jgi:predicted nucleic acid-binding protein
MFSNMTPTKSSKKSPISENWVLNASPIIALARIGQLQLLKLLPERTVVPRAVADELLEASEDDLARRAIEIGMFRIVRNPTASPEILAWDLGKGETSVLSYAYANPVWVAILDDATARRCARSFSLKHAGTLSDHSSKATRIDYRSSTDFACIKRRWFSIG